MTHTPNNPALYHMNAQDTFATRLELDNIKALLDHVETLNADFHDLRPTRYKWNLGHIKKLSHLIETVEHIKNESAHLGFYAWQKTSARILLFLERHHHNKTTPAIEQFHATRNTIQTLEQEMRQLYILKHDHAAHINLSRQSNLIFILEDDTQFSAILAAQLKRQGFEVECFDTIEEMEHARKRIHADLHLIDLNLHEGKLAGIDYIKHSQDSTTPAFAITGKSDMDTRVASKDAGAQEFLTKPIDLDKLKQLIAKHLDAGYRNGPKTLIIDDDDLTAKTYAQFLDHYGLETRILTDGSKIFEELERHWPDLIFMDVKMPFASGYELADMIYEAYGTENSPTVVFMTGALEKNKSDYDTTDLADHNLHLKPLSAIQMANIVYDTTLGRRAM